MGALFAAVLLYPLDVVKTRKQVDVSDEHAALAAASKRKSHNMWLTCWLIYRHEGVGGLFAGLSSKVVHTVVSNFAYFYWYSFLKQAAERRSGTAISTGMNLLIASLAGALNMSMTLPLEMINTRAQIQPSDSESSSDDDSGEEKTDAPLAVKAGSPDKKSARHPTMWDLTKEIYAEDGLLSFWKGFIPSLVLVSNPSINFTVFDKLKLRLQTSKMAAANGTRLASLTAWEAFMLAAVAKAIATVLTYPVIRAKVLMQAQKKQLASQQAAAPSADPAHPHHHHHHHHHPSDVGSSMLQVLRRIGELEGPSGYFKGCSAQLFNTVLKSALLLMTKEQITKYTMRVLYMLRRDAGAKAIAAAKA